MDEPQKAPDVTLPAEASDGDELWLPDGRGFERVDGQWQEIPEVVTGGESPQGRPPWYEDPANDWVD